MKAMKKALALLLCFVMTIGIFSVANITFEDLAGLFSIKAEAYTNTTIGRITQQQVVGKDSNGNDTSVDGIITRDFWYSVHANGYFNGHSEPTNMVIPGLGDGDDYTPQGMTYWPQKNWVLMSAYDASGQGRASCIYAIDVASGKFKLFSFCCVHTEVTPFYFWFSIDLLFDFMQKCRKIIRQICRKLKIGFCGRMYKSDHGRVQTLPVKKVLMPFFKGGFAVEVRF